MSEENLYTTPFVILSSYLANFSVSAAPPREPVLKSSADIQDALADMCSISIDDIANMLVSMHFTVSLEADGTPRWVMFPNY